MSAYAGPRERCRSDVRTALAALFAALAMACLAQAAWIHVKAQLAQALIARAWERAKQGELQAKPWPWADTRPVLRLELESDGEAIMVLNGTSGRTLAFGPAHDPASVLPGERGNSVIAGHRDTHFRMLERMRVGDRVRVERLDGRELEFEVTNVTVADSRKTRIALDGETSRLTLVTCFPFEAVRPGGPLRFVVTADLIAEAGKVASITKPPFTIHARRGVYAR